MINTDYILVYATTRSGHHAFINWLACQIPYKVVRYNSPNVKAFIDGEFRADGNRLTVRRYNEKKDKKIILVNFEDFDFTAYKDVSSSPLLALKNKFNVVFLRDAYNTIASNIVGLKGRSDEKFLYPRVRAWIQHAREFLGHTDYVDNLMRINYNEWVSDREYRRCVCMDVFDCDFTDEGINVIPDVGAGSSFDSMSYKNNARNMDVLNRYKRLLGDEKFEKVLKDYPELHELNYKIFGFKLK